MTHQWVVKGRCAMVANCWRLAWTPIKPGYCLQQWHSAGTPLFKCFRESYFCDSKELSRPYPQDKRWKTKGNFLLLVFTKQQLVPITRPFGTLRNSLMHKIGLQKVYGPIVINVPTIAPLGLSHKVSSKVTS